MVGIVCEGEKTKTLRNKSRYPVTTAPPCKHLSSTPCEVNLAMDLTIPKHLEISNSIKKNNPTTVNKPWAQCFFLKSYRETNQTSRKCGKKAS